MSQLELPVYVTEQGVFPWAKGLNRYQLTKEALTVNNKHGLFNFIALM